MKYFFLDYAIGFTKITAVYWWKNCSSLKNRDVVNDSALTTTKLRLSLQETSENTITATSKVQKLHLTEYSFW